MDCTKGKWYLEIETGFILSIPDGTDSPIIVASLGGSTTPITPKLLKETLANAQLIVAAVNGCASVNPDNPMAVAESIKELYEVCKKIISQNGWAYKEDIDLIKQALAKADGKAQHKPSIPLSAMVEPEGFGDREFFAEEDAKAEDKGAD